MFPRETRAINHKWRSTLQPSNSTPTHVGVLHGRRIKYTSIQPWKIFFLFRRELALSRGRTLTELSTVNTGHAARGFNTPENTDVQRPFHSFGGLPVGRRQTVASPPFSYSVSREFTKAEKDRSRESRVERTFLFCSEANSITSDTRLSEMSAKT